MNCQAWSNGWGLTVTSILRNHRVKVLNRKLKGWMVYSWVQKILNTKVLTNSQAGCFKMHNSSLKTLDNHSHNYLKPNERKTGAT